MNLSARTHSAGFPIYSVSIGDSEFELSTFGGQLLSWTKGGVPVLFENQSRAVFDGKAPYRGGAPICFPYFGKGVLLPSDPIAPQHGRARTTVWQPEIREAESAIILRTEQPAPDGFGPSILSCELTYLFAEDGVRIEARTINAGERETPFQLAVHSYWACEKPAEAKVTGLNDRFLENLVGLKESRDAAPSDPHLPPFDRIYPDAADSLQIDTEQLQVQISTENCSGTVLWNPGPDHGLNDLGTPDFVCVESGVVTPSRTLQPGEDHRLSIDYRVKLK